MISFIADSVITTKSASSKSFTLRFEGKINFTLGIFLADNSKFLFSSALKSATINVLPETFTWFWVWFPFWLPFAICGAFLVVALICCLIMAGIAGKD